MASVSWIPFTGVFGSRIGPVGFATLDLPVARVVVERVTVFVVDVFPVTFTYLSGFDHVPSGFIAGNPFGHLFWFLLILCLSPFLSFSCSGHLCHRYAVVGTLIAFESLAVSCRYAGIKQNNFLITKAAKIAAIYIYAKPCG